MSNPTNVIVQSANIATNFLSEYALVLKTVFFVCFFLFAAIVIYSRDSTNTTRGFLAVFFTLLLLSGSIGIYAWPFFNWNLYPHSQDPQETFYEMRVVDDEGNELKYDARAVPPSLATPIKRYSKEMVHDFTGEEKQTFGCFLIDSAQEYRNHVRKDSNSPIDYVKFPRHQTGFRWTESDMDRLGEIVGIRVYRIDVVLSTDGKEVLQYSEESTVTISETACS